MGLKLGEKICWRNTSEIDLHGARIQSVDDTEVVILTEGPAPNRCAEGGYVVISSEDAEHYMKIAGISGRTLRLRKLWSEKREHFRVDDVLGIKAGMSPDIKYRKSKLFSSATLENADAGLPDDALSPALWKMLVNINSKLEYIVQRFQFETNCPGLEEKPVNLSASGIRFTMETKVCVGDVMEIRMLLPTCPPTGILTYGTVVRASETDGGKYEVGMHFLDMEGEVKDELAKYMIKRQRSIIRKMRE